MTLTFPTQAERAVRMWRNLNRTQSFNIIASRCFKAQREDEWDETGSFIRWTFDDDTSVTVRGRGRNHKLETHLP